VEAGLMKNYSVGGRWVAGKHLSEGEAGLMEKFIV